MILEETQDNKDTLIILMIQERDKQIKLLEIENANLKKLLLKQLEENRHLIKIVKELKYKRYGGTEDWIEKNLKITNIIKYG